MTSEELPTHFTSSSGREAAGFHSSCDYEAVDLGGYLRSGERGEEIEQVKTPQNLLFLPKFNHFYQTIQGTFPEF